ncbi:MAG: putative Transposable element Tc3 transposase [Streblomastix strix]|uniref:Putative Transposable element Tc3 transposase n=1 Tax=Streblomastix strix TaxID=222440 RepID=A0A5J4XCW4_9EUKA|nr:MAG: putative Transposable element Tc3 transposase [Streblomastix strix]
MDTDSMYFSIAGSQTEGYKQGLKYVIKDQLFYDLHNKERLPWDNCTVAKEKRLMNLTTESQGENIICLAPKCYSLYNGNEQNEDIVSLVNRMKGVSEKKTNLTNDDYIKCLNDGGVALSLAKKKRIIELSEKKKLSFTKISQKQGIPYETVRQVLLHRNNLLEPKKRGPKPKVAVRAFRRISRYLKKTSKSIPQNINKSAKKRLRRRPKLTERHIAKRIQFAEEFLLNDQSKKTEIIFSDEKKFRFDGPDGWAYYWYSLDEKDDNSIYSKDYGKYKGVMVLATINSAGILSHDRMQGSITAVVQRELLLSQVFPSIHTELGEQFKYQMDSASCHKNKETLKDLESYGFSFLDWPALSPDLNPVENMWSILVRKVYEDGVNYENEEDLWAGIQGAGRKITKKDILLLNNSFQKRFTELLKRGGKYVQ